MEEQKMKLGNLRKIVSSYKELDNKKLNKKEIKKNEQLKLDLQQQGFHYISKKVGYDSIDTQMLEEIFNRVEGAKDLYTKEKQRREKIEQDDREYRANIKEITETLKVGDVIIDDEDEDEWIVTEVDRDIVTVKKRKGRKILEIEGDKGKWEEILKEEEEDKDPLVFEKMFKEVKK